jgi:hypothetical protein
LSHASRLFCSGYYENRVSLIARLVLTSSSYFTLPSVAMMTNARHDIQLLVEMGVVLTFCPCSPWTMIHSISGSQVARITSVNHHHPTWSIFWTMISSQT